MADTCDIAEGRTPELVDSVDVTVVVDNHVDSLLPSTGVARRPARTADWYEADQLRAEHGFSLLVSVGSRGERQSLLYDCGLGWDTAVHNLDVLGVPLDGLRAVVLSHGHPDHHGGLGSVIRRVRDRLPVVLHPDALRHRVVALPTGVEVRLRQPSAADLAAGNVTVVAERGPSLLLDGTVLVTGQVERTTPFEKGFPRQRAAVASGEWEPDPWTWDDQAVVVNVRDRGLVVLSSCSHAGAVNVLRAARRITGVDRVHAWIGGLHLTGTPEPVIADTVAAFAEIAPDVVVPAHCTGWRATQELARALPKAYCQSSVGTRFHFSAT